MTPLAQKIIERIHHEHITPTPAWYFQARSVAWWLGVISMIFLAGLSTAFSFHLVFEMRWEALEHVSKNWGALLFLSTPVVWLSLVTLFVLLAWYCFHHSKHGYRYSFFTIVSLCILTSVLVALALEFTPLDQGIENFFLHAASSQNLFKNLIK